MLEDEYDIDIISKYTESELMNFCKSHSDGKLARFNNFTIVLVNLISDDAKTINHSEKGVTTKTQYGDWFEMYKGSAHHGSQNQRILVCGYEGVFDDNLYIELEGKNNSSVSLHNSKKKCIIRNIDYQCDI